MVSMRRKKTREERDEDFRKQNAPREAAAAGGPGAQVAFNPNPLGAQSGVTMRLTHHTAEGDVPIDPSLARAGVGAGVPQAPPGGVPPLTPEQAAAAAGGAVPQPTPQPVQVTPAQPVQPQQPPGVVPQALVPQPAPPQAPPPPQGFAQPQGLYGVPQMPVHPGELAPTSAPGPHSAAPGLPSATMGPGMAPAHVVTTPGVHPPSSIVQQHQAGAAPAVPAALGGPQQLVVDVQEGTAETVAEPLDVTIILTSWSRPGLLRPQYGALLQQTRPPSSLVAWVNAPPAGGPPGVPVLDEEILAGMLQVRSSINWGPWPRFYFAMEATTEYVVILDDDAIPGLQWLEAAINAVDEGVAVAVTGTVFDADGNPTLVGGAGSESERMAVDAGRQGWVLKREWLNAIMALPRNADRNYGWGIHVAAALQKLGIDTVVLPYAADAEALWGTTLPEQTDGLRNVSEGAEMRAEVFNAYRELGWKLWSDPGASGEDAPEATE